MGVRLDHHVRTLLDALAFAWPATAFALRLHTPKPIAPVDDDDDDDGDDDDKRGGGSGGSIDPDDDDGGDADDDEDDEEDTLWTQFGFRLRANPT
jgi:hypothetical protein